MENTQKIETERTSYEIEKGSVARKKLESQIMSQLQQLDDVDFHTIYSLVWSLGAKDMLYRIEKSKDKGGN